MLIALNLLKFFNDGGNSVKSIYFSKASMICYMTSVVLLFTGCHPSPASDTNNTAPSTSEKTSLKIGFIKLTDMAPLAIAAEQGFFKDEGLQVQLEAQPNWKVLYERVQKGDLDGAHMLAAMPLASMTTTSDVQIISPFTMSYNGAGITVSNAIWTEMKKNIPLENDKPKHPISASTLKPIVDQYKQQKKPFNLGMTFPTGTHNYMLRYWLAAGGINPGKYDPNKNDFSGNIDADVNLSVVPPPEMMANMVAGTTLGYAVGEPWNQKAVKKGFGVPVITSDVLWENGADKVFGVTSTFAEKNPNTTIKVVKALIRASHWLDENDHIHRREAAKLIAQTNYVGVDEDIIANSMTGVFEYEKGDIRPLKSFNTFFTGQYGIPYYSDAIWWLTQMRRWGQIPETKPDHWYLEIAQKTYRPDIYTTAANSLIAEGKMKREQFPNLTTATFIKAPQASRLDGIVFDANKPTAFLAAFKIGNK